MTGGQEGLMEREMFAIQALPEPYVFEGFGPSIWSSAPGSPARRGSEAAARDDARPALNATARELEPTVAAKGSTAAASLTQATDEINYTRQASTVDGPYGRNDGRSETARTMKPRRWHFPAKASSKGYTGVAVKRETIRSSMHGRRTARSSSKELLLLPVHVDARAPASTRAFHDCPTAVYPAGFDEAIARARGGRDRAIPPATLEAQPVRRPPASPAPDPLRGKVGLD
jgi:hypothetical protein